MSHAYVLVEHSGGRLDALNLELITAARALGAVTAVVVGDPGLGEKFSADLGSWGAETIISAESTTYAQRFILPEVDALHALGANNPGPIIIAASAKGNEIAGRVAVRLDSGVLIDVTAINPDKTARHSIFGDTIDVSTAVGGACPVFTLRPGATEGVAQPAAGKVHTWQLPEATAKDITVTDFEPAASEKRPELSQAKIVIAGGRGVGSVENFTTIIEPLADALGAAVGVTRDAVDLGYYPSSYQIGQTGVSISPDLYIGFGISGAIQHVSGIQAAKKIIAVNTDEDAEIFRIADIGVVGDLFDIAPQLLEEIKRRQ